MYRKGWAKDKRRLGDSNQRPSDSVKGALTTEPYFKKNIAGRSLPRRPALPRALPDPIHHQLALFLSSYPNIFEIMMRDR